MARPQAKGPANSGSVVLTFDDGPHPVHTPRILDILKEAGAVATFLPLGQHVESHPEIMRAALSEGHEVGNHTYSHPHFNRDGEQTLSTEAIREEITRAQQILKKHLHIDARTFRAPYFDFNEAVDTVTDELGLMVLGNSVYPGDWMPDVTADELITKSLTAKAGDVLLFHDRSATMVEALPAILAGLQHKGLTFATAADLFAH